MGLVVRLLILTVSVYIASFIPGISISSPATILVVAIVLGLINTFIKPLLVLLTLPVAIITLGLFLLVLNGILILIVGAIVPGFQVNSLLSAILFSIVVSLVSAFLSKLS